MLHDADHNLAIGLSEMIGHNPSIGDALDAHSAVSALPGVLPALRALTLRELLARNIEPREMILAPWLPTQGLAMVHAKRGTGKTYFALSVAYAVATGSEFLGWAADKPRGVLYVDGEMPEATIQERLARFVATDNKYSDAADPPLYILTPDEVRGPMPNLASPEGQNQLEPLLPGVDLIVVDHISALCNAGRENEAESWLSTQEWALRMRSRGFSILFVHHSGKGGQQRGTSRREDVLDSVISLRQPAGYLPDQGAHFEVHFEKNRGFHGSQAKPFEAQLVTDRQQGQEWVLRDIEDSTAHKVASLLGEGMPQKEIAEFLGVAKGTVSKAKKKAGQLGLIEDCSHG